MASKTIGHAHELIEAPVGTVVVEDVSFKNVWVKIRQGQNLWRTPYMFEEPLPPKPVGYDVVYSPDDPDPVEELAAELWRIRADHAGLDLPFEKVVAEHQEIQRDLARYVLEHYTKKEDE